VRFEWGSGKAATNLKKHKVSFDEASTVFHDPLAVILMTRITLPMTARDHHRR